MTNKFKLTLVVLLGIGVVSGLVFTQTLQEKQINNLEQEQQVLPTRVVVTNLPTASPSATLMPSPTVALRKLYLTPVISKPVSK